MVIGDHLIKSCPKSSRHSRLGGALCIGKEGGISALKVDVLWTLVSLINRSKSYSSHRDCTEIAKINSSCMPRPLVFVSLGFNLVHVVGDPIFSKLSILVLISSCQLSLQTSPLALAI